MTNKTLDFYRTNRANGMRASLALDYARRQSARYAAEVEPLPYGKARSAACDSIVPKRRPATAYNPASNGKRWIEHASGNLRVHKARDLVRFEHTGWYCDVFQDSVTYGAVIQLPARNGQARYYPAYSDPWNDDCYYVDFTQHHSHPESCARAADDMARREGEEQVEYGEADQAGQRYSSYIDAAQSARKACLELIADFKAEQRDGKTARESICQAIRGKIASYVREWQESKREASSLLNDLHYSADSRNEHYRDLWRCFAESAGIKTAKLSTI